MSNLKNVGLLAHLWASEFHSIDRPLEGWWLYSYQAVPRIYLNYKTKFYHLIKYLIIGREGEPR